ncbi:HPP family protein [Planctomycetota bacterium]
MEKNISWIEAEDTVEQAVTKMQKEDSGYIMVGTKDELEGIVSSADLAGAVSPYLRPAFAKWRRPLDDATLQIKVKWIMSKPVRTVKLDTPLAVIMEEMRRFAGRCVPVMDAQGKIQGIITAFTIFKALLRSAG